MVGASFFIDMKCDKCPKKPRCKELCQKIKDYLRSQGIRSADWIRPRVSSKKRTGGKWREIPFSALNRGKDGEILDKS